MENLFFLIVVLVIIITNVISIRNRMKKQQSGESDEARPGEKQDRAGWRNSVEKFLEQMREELEPAPEDPTGYRPRSRDQEAVLPEKREEQPARTAGREQRVEKDKKTYMESLGKDAETAGKRYADKRKEIGQDAIGAPAIEKKSAPASLPAREFSAVTGDTYSVAQLQKAVIWSEILGSPVALRKEGREIH